MDIAVLQYFIKTAKIQHMSNAAAELNISQSALSTNIKKLEEELGVKLFDRKGKYIYLNEYGKVFLEYAKGMVYQYNSVKYELNNMKEEQENKVTVSMPALSSFPGLMNHIKEKCPGIIFRNIQTEYTERVNMLLSRNVAFCIMGAKLNHPDLEETLISVDELVMLVPDHYEISKKNKVDLIEFREYEFANVIRRAATNFKEVTITDLELYCNIAGFTPKIKYWCDQFYELIDAIRDGHFVGMVAKRILKGYNLQGISIVELNSPECYSNLRLYRLKDSRETKAEKAVRISIMEYFRPDGEPLFDTR